MTSYYGPAEIISEHGTMIVHADLAIEMCDASTVRQPGQQVLGRWHGSVDKRLGGDIHPIRSEQVTLRLPDGNDAQVHLGELRLRTNEPVGWDLVGIGKPPFGMPQ